MFNDEQAACGSMMDTNYNLRKQCVTPPTYTERVEMAVANAESQLKDLKRMQEIFAQHPEFEELLTLVQRGRV